MLWYVTAKSPSETINGLFLLLWKPCAQFIPGSFIRQKLFSYHKAFLPVFPGSDGKTVQPNKWDTNINTPHSPVTLINHCVLESTLPFYVPSLPIIQALKFLIHQTTLYCWASHSILHCFRYNSEVALHLQYLVINTVRIHYAKLSTKASMIWLLFSSVSIVKPGWTLQCWDVLSTTLHLSLAETVSHTWKTLTHLSHFTWIMHALHWPTYTWLPPGVPTSFSILPNWVSFPSWILPCRLQLSHLNSDKVHRTCHFAYLSLSLRRLRIQSLSAEFRYAA